MTLLFAWPASAQVDREISKERLYKEGAVGAAVRRLFVEEVQHVRWAYKLGESSIRLRGDGDVPEVQIFGVELKGVDLSDRVLATIDKAVPSPIIFELHRSSAGGREVQLAATRKRRRQNGVTIGDYLRGSWTAELADREPLPPAIDLPGLYAQIMLTLVPIAARRGEGLGDVLERAGAVRKLEREITSLDRRLRREAQFNRKIDLRAEIRARSAELHALRDTSLEN